MKKIECNVQTGEIVEIDFTAEEVTAANEMASAHAAINTLANKNAVIPALMAAADLRIIRALTEGDVERIAAHRDAQALLRGKIS